MARREALLGVSNMLFAFMCKISSEAPEARHGFLSLLMGLPWF